MYINLINSVQTELWPNKAEFHGKFLSILAVSNQHCVLLKRNVVPTFLTPLSKQICLVRCHLVVWQS